MPLGIRPTIDMAFKKTFGTPENKLCLISLLNSILDLESPITDVTIENPYNLQDFESDKLSILDVKAVDQSGTIYDIEISQRQTCRRPIRWIGGYSGCYTLTNTNRKNCCDCFRKQRFSKRHGQSHRSHKRRKTKPCTMHAKRQSATINPRSILRSRKVNKSGSKEARKSGSNEANRSARREASRLANSGAR